MPLIYYLCKCGLSKSKFYRRSGDAPSSFSCIDCGKEYTKQLAAPSNTSVFVVDNGHQAKSVEVNLEVVKSNEENSTKDFREKD